MDEQRNENKIGGDSSDMSRPCESILEKDGFEDIGDTNSSTQMQKFQSSKVPSSTALECSGDFSPSYTIQVSNSSQPHIKAEPSDFITDNLYHAPYLAITKSEVEDPPVPSGDGDVFITPKCELTQETETTSNIVDKDIIETTESGLDNESLGLHIIENTPSGSLDIGTVDNTQQSQSSDNLFSFKSPNNDVCLSKSSDAAFGDTIDLTDDTVEVHTNVRFGSKKKKKKKKRSKEKDEDPSMKKKKKKKKQGEGSPPIQDTSAAATYYKGDDFIVVENLQFSESNDEDGEDHEDMGGKNGEIYSSNSLHPTKSDRPTRQRNVVNYSEYLMDPVDSLKYECQLCKLCFQTQDLLDIHSLEHPVQNTLISCNECGKCFNNILGLRTHTRKMHNDDEKKLLRCNWCLRSYHSSIGLKRHKKTCGQENVKTQIEENEDAELSSKLKCPEPGCELEFLNLRAYKKHARTHSISKPYPCPECGKHFSLWPNLMRHVKTHYNIKSFQCLHCEKMFCEKSAMISHMRHIHTGEKPFSCDICSKAFVTKSDLNRHGATHSDEKKYECLDCGKRFKLKVALVSHMKRKNAEKSWQCGVCSKTFASKGNLQCHMAIHSEYKLYKCEVCGKECSQATGLREHMRTHTGELAFSCKYCGQRFSFQSNKTRHEKTVHLHIEQRFSLNSLSESGEEV